MNGFKTDASIESAAASRKPIEGASDDRFDADEWSALSPEQRIRRCNVMAEHAQLLAKTAPPEIAQRYIHIANEWLQLATEMQHGGPRAVSRGHESR